MTLTERMKKKVEELEEAAQEIEELATEMLNLNEFDYHPSTSGVVVFGPNHSWKPPDDEIKKIQRSAIRKYQTWFTSSTILIKEYLPHREEEFVKVYEKILAYLRFKIETWKPVNKVYVDGFIDVFDIQRSIFLAIPSVIDLKEFELRRLISGDLVDDELEEAQLLFKNKHYRAAGAIAGVALERHLKTLCDTSTPPVPYKKKDTIDPLATALYKAEKMDITMLKKIQHLASIRNRCDHPEEVEEKEIEELIREANAVSSK